MKPQTRLAEFCRAVFTPSVVYDIGANDPCDEDGILTTHRPLMPNAKFYLVEAMPKHLPALQASGEDFALAALTDLDGRPLEFFETSRFPRGTGDSYYRERTSYYSDDFARELKLVGRRLDTLASSLGWRMPDFLKLDTQGSELDILHGCGDVLSGVKAIQIEMSLADYNAGAPTFRETLDALDDYGFRPYDLFDPLYHGKGRLMQIDALFVRKK